MERLPLARMQRGKLRNRTAQRPAYRSVLFDFVAVDEASVYFIRLYRDYSAMSLACDTVLVMTDVDVDASRQLRRFMMMSFTVP